MWASAMLPLFAASGFAQYTTAPPAQNETTGPDADGKYEISAEGIRAHFIPYGASISNLFINDTNGIERDIVLGFDNASHYSVDPFHPHLGGVPGSFAPKIIRIGSSKLTGTYQGAMPTASKTRPSQSMAWTTTSMPTRTAVLIPCTEDQTAGTT